MKYAGIKNNKICVVANHFFHSNALQIVKVDVDVCDNDLIRNYKFIDNKFVKTEMVAIENLKIAFIGNVDIKCGISTYNSFLIPELSKFVKEIKLFPEGKIWKRGESLLNLVSEVKSYNPDIIFIAHEFGLFPNARHFLSMMSQFSNFRVICIMHSVFHHKDKTIIEAAMPEIVVHLEGAKNVLKEEKGVPGKVYVVPHGSFPCESERFWNFYKSKETFVQFGFGFRYKRWENAIIATSILKSKYENVFFTGLFSYSEFNKFDHDKYFNELLELIEKLDVKENVALIRGYQSDTSLDAYLKTNQIALFPYESDPKHVVYGASGAARIAMSKGIPVITTSIPHFSDLPTIKANSPQEIADELDKLFSSPGLKNKQVQKQINYINSTTWEKVAGYYAEIFKNIYA